jgi:hypothetical protein
LTFKDEKILLFHFIQGKYGKATKTKNKESEMTIVEMPIGEEKGSCNQSRIVHGTYVSIIAILVIFGGNVDYVNNSDSSKSILEKPKNISEKKDDGIYTNIAGDETIELLSGAKAVTTINSNMIYSQEDMSEVISNYDLVTSKLYYRVSSLEDLLSEVTTELSNTEDKLLSKEKPTTVTKRYYYKKVGGGDFSEIIPTGGGIVDPGDYELVQIITVKEKPTLEEELDKSNYTDDNTPKEGEISGRIELDRQNI